MDNVAISLILTALTTGTVAGLQDTTSQVIKDAYNELRTRIQSKFADRPNALVTLTEHEKKPDIWKAHLEAELKETGVDQDQEIIAAAQRLITLIRSEQAMIGKYNIQNVGSVQNQIVGDKHTITINTSSKDLGKEDG